MTLPWFPALLPDELLYSGCARYAEVFAFPNQKDVATTLFGRDSITSVPDLPCHLEALAKRLQPGLGLSVERLIDAHTLLPLYAPFYPRDRIERVRDGMRTDGFVKSLLGLHAQRQQSPKSLRYCPACVLEDELAHGVVYWHRVHQVHGVLVCPHHEKWLKSSPVAWRFRRTRHNYVTVSRALESRSEPIGFVDVETPPALVAIARDAGWLLQHPEAAGTGISLNKRYRTLLAERDLASTRGRLQLGRFTAQFLEWCPTDYLNTHVPNSLAECAGWLTRLLRSSPSAKVPFHQLLLTHFLGQNIASLLNAPTREAPKRKWPCLNPVCSSFRRPVAQIYAQRYTHDHGKLVRVFHCTTCGFTYERTGVDRNTGAAYCFHRVPEFGRAWDAALQSGWLDQTVSLRRLAHQLGVDPVTVKRQATRLGLTARNTREQPIKRVEPVLEPLVVQVSPVRDTNLDRTAWLELCEYNPEASRTELRRLAPALFARLYRNDRAWLSGQPPLRQQSLGRQLIDWTVRDAVLLERVKSAVAVLRQRTGKPMQITRGAIVRECQAPSWLHHNMHRLPHSTRALHQLAESRTAFAVRRIEYQTRLATSQEITLNQWQLIRRAGLRPELVSQPSVLEAISRSLVTFQQTVL